MKLKSISLFLAIIFTFSFSSLIFAEIKLKTNYCSEQDGKSYLSKNITIFSKEKPSESTNDSNKKQSSIFYIQRAAYHSSHEKLDEAERELRKGLELYNTNTNLLMMLKTLEAVKNGKINKKFASYHFNGIYLLSTRNPDKAIVQFNKAKRLDYTNPSTFFCLGISYKVLKDYFKAKKNFLKAKLLFKREKNDLGLQAVEEYLSQIQFLRK